MEYAGPYRAAHSGGHNSDWWGHLVLLGVETITAAVKQNLIDGVIRARIQAVAAGHVTEDHAVEPHSAQRQTSCPGPIYTDKTIWNAISRPLFGGEMKEIYAAINREGDTSIVHVGDGISRWLMPAGDYHAIYKPRFNPTWRGPQPRRVVELLGAYSG